MRRLLFLIPCVAVIVFFAPRNCSAQGAEDYDVPLVKTALQEQLQGISLSFREKYVSRLGDRVSIALLKILDDGDFKDPRTLRAALRLVRQSFMYPNLISIIQDKKPKITLFLLNNLNGNTGDASLKGEISALIKFVKEKTGSNSINSLGRPAMR